MECHLQLVHLASPDALSYPYHPQQASSDHSPQRCPHRYIFKHTMKLISGPELKEVTGCHKNNCQMNLTTWGVALPMAWDWPPWASIVEHFQITKVTTSSILLSKNWKQESVILAIEKLSFPGWGPSKQHCSLSHHSLPHIQRHKMVKQVALPWQIPKAPALTT